MRKEELQNLRKVVNKKYNTEEVIIFHDVLMKDSQRGWIPAVFYAGEDRNPPHQTKFFCKNEEDFLNEFDLKEEKED